MRDLEVSVRIPRVWARRGRAAGTRRGVRRAIDRLRAEAEVHKARLRRLLSAHRATARSAPSTPLRRAPGPEEIRRARERAFARLRRAHRRAVRRPSRSGLHRVRKRLRELGLLQELAELAHPIGRPRLGRRLQRWMRQLGGIHDRTILLGWLERQPRKGLTATLRKIRRSVRRDRRRLRDELDTIREKDWAHWTAPAVRHRGK